MKHAYLIIAHNEPRTLRLLLKTLDDERNDIYLHIDRNAQNLNNLLTSLKMEHAKLYVLDPISGYWGDISLVEIEFRLLERATSRQKYAYYHLLSGTDLPLKNQDFIHDFFIKHAGKEFVGFWQDSENQRDLERKVYRYYFFTRQLRGKRKKVDNLKSLLRNVVLGLQKIAHYRRSKDFEFKKGFQWWSITDCFAHHLLTRRGIIMRRMHWTLCPDEIFVQTVLWNSVYRKNIYSNVDPETGSMRKIDWWRGSPYEWSTNDLEELAASPMLFTRKISAKRMDLNKYQLRVLGRIYG